MTLDALYDLAVGENIQIDNFYMNNIKSLSVPGAIAINRKELSSSAEEKVYLAHELGHCTYAGFYNVSTPLNTKGRIEARANRFTIKTLIPKDKLLQAVKEGYTEHWELAEYFNVTDELMIKAVEFYQYND